MRIDELISFDRQPVATAQFRQDLSDASDQESDIVPKLKKLIQFKRHSAPDQSMSKKDYILKYGPLHGYWHYHLIFGRLIVIYALDRDQIRLIRIGPHSWIEGGYDPGFEQYIKGLKPSDYTPFELGDDISVSDLNAQDLAKLKITLYGLATNATDRDMLKAAVKGHVDQDMMDLMISNLDGPSSDAEKWLSIQRAFGGMSGLSKAIATILRNTEIS